MPSKEKIFDYWCQNPKALGFIKKGYDGGVCEGECFACGNFIFGLHRCHIKSLVMGGTNDLENLHLLCPQCHIESESSANYWNWLHYKRDNEWDFMGNHLIKYITKQGYDLDKIAAELDATNATQEQLEQCIHTILTNCGFKRKTLDEH